jgi:glyoxylase-like metal-dependent hydrolase (beta-lactamase superfamily II)
LPAEAERRGLRIVALVNTHGHFDHIADNRALLDAAGAPPPDLLAHPLEASRLAHPQALFPLPFAIPPTIPDRLVGEGDTVRVGRWTFTVLHTPGHSEGSICLFEPDAGLLFSGDTLFAGTHGRTDFPGGDAAGMNASLARLAALPASTRVLPGHGPATTIERERAWIRRPGAGR